MGQSLKNQFIIDVRQLRSTPKVLTVAVELPSGAIEVITNTEGLQEKFEWYTTKYDEDFKLIANPVIRIVGYMLV